ncbi:MAG: 50S ribosomal protein L10 [Rickettsiaceae bacterium]
MLKSEKINCVKSLEDVYSNSLSLVVVHYHGLTVNELEELRSTLREHNAYLKIAKNTLLKIAAQNIGLVQVRNILSGPTAVIYSEDSLSAVKHAVKFAKSHKNLNIIGGIVDEVLLSIDEIKQIAELPSIEVLRAKIVGLLQAPAQKLASVTQAPASNLARLFKIYSNNN